MTSSRLALGFMLLALFLAVAGATAATLFAVNGGPPPMEVRVVCSPHSQVMPEDLERIDRSMECR